MFACACGEITSTNAERPCRDCGHFPYFHEDDEFKFDKQEERAKDEAKKLEISTRIQEDRIKSQMEREARKKAKANRTKEQELFAKKLTHQYYKALDTMAEDGGYLADCEQAHLKKRRDVKHFRRNQKEKQFLLSDILNIRRYHIRKQNVSKIFQ